MFLLRGHQAVRFPVLFDAGTVDEGYSNLLFFVRVRARVRVLRMYTVACVEVIYLRGVNVAAAVQVTSLLLRCVFLRGCIPCRLKFSYTLVAYDKS